MRKIINISLPEELDKEIEKKVKEGKYSTKSEFFRDLVRMWLEGRILKELNESKREIASGDGKKLKSLKKLR